MTQSIAREEMQHSTVNPYTQCSHQRTVINRGVSELHLASCTVPYQQSLLRHVSPSMCTSNPVESLSVAPVANASVRSVESVHTILYHTGLSCLIFGSTVPAIIARTNTKRKPPPIHHGVNTTLMLKNNRINSRPERN
jgi:hypothetical protein